MCTVQVEKWRPWEVYFTKQGFDAGIHSLMSPLQGMVLTNLKSQRRDNAMQHFIQVRLDATGRIGTTVSSSTVTILELHVICNEQTMFTRSMSMRNVVSLSALFGNT